MRKGAFRMELLLPVRRGDPAPHVAAGAVRHGRAGRARVRLRGLAALRRPAGLAGAAPPPLVTTHDRPCAPAARLLTARAWRGAPQLAPRLCSAIGVVTQTLTLCLPPPRRAGAAAGAARGGLLVAVHRLDALCGDMLLMT